MTVAPAVVLISKSKNLPMDKKPIKLYIWRDIRRDYTGGIGFAAARSKEEAMEAIKAISEPWEWDVYRGELLRVEPEVHDIPFGGWISGGG